jgi:hypothetical protein
MGEWAGWIAPLATTLAACITAANLGARVTGWGFVVFTIGSVAWTTYGIATGQQNLLWQNVLLTVVNVIGIWRWLGRRARFDDGAQAAAKASEERDAPTLFPISMLTDCQVTGAGGETLATTVDAMADCDGRIAYLVVSAGGIGGVGETLHALDWAAVRADPSGITAPISKEQFAELPAIETTNWPARVPPPLTTGSA